MILLFSVSKMGRVRTKTVKKASRFIIEKYYTKLTLDFHTNKRIMDEVALIPSKPLRNKEPYLIMRKLLILVEFKDRYFSNWFFKRVSWTWKEIGINVYPSN